MSSASRNVWTRQLRARPRLLFSAAVGLVVLVVLPQAWAHNAVTRALVAWNVGVLLYLVLAGVMMTRAHQDHIRQRARLEEEGRSVALILVSLGVAASLVAIALQLSVAKELEGVLRSGHVGLAALTVFTSWAFMQMMFALHYAHEYYSPRQHGQQAGLDFPGTPDPDYGDFLYAACVIGTSAQTADVSFNSQRVRRVGLLHSVLAFFYNTIVLALAINIAASLI